MVQLKSQLPENEVEKINRLKQVRKEFKIGQQILADKLGIERTSLSSIENFRENRKVPNVTRYILEKEYGINGDWFETGQGEMIKASSSLDVFRPEGRITSLNTNRRKKAALIPFYNADFMAGKGEMLYDDGTIYPEYYMDVPEFSGCTAFRAYSDSMETRIKSGNILFGTKLDDWKSHLEYGQIYGITCTDGRRYLKYIRKANDEKMFLLKSENPNYDDFTLPKDKINNIWLIEGWLDKRT